MSGDVSDAAAALAAAQAPETDLKQRLVALVAGASTLFGSPNLADMLPAVVVLARTLIPADGYAVWRHDGDSDAGQIGASHGVSERFRQRIVDIHGGGGLAPGALTDPLIAERVEKEPILEARLDAYREEGIESMLAVPLKIGGRATGTLVFYYRSRHAFTEIEVHTARALGAMSAAAISAADLYHEQRRMREQIERASKQTLLLAQASAALASSLDYEATLRTVANLAVPQLADWCAVDVVDEQGVTRRLAVAHVDPSKVELALTYHDRYPENPDAPGPITTVIKSGTPVMVPEVTDSMIVEAARSEDHLVALRRLAVRSYICVPMIVHARTIGAITFVNAESGRYYTPAEFQLAQDLAYRSALAVENARAYRQANVANRIKDEFLATLSHELRTPLNAVLGWTRMLRSGTITGAKMLRAFEIIERNAVAQLDLVEDLLDLSRIVRGKFRLDLQPVRLSGALDAAVEAVQPAATAKGIGVEVRAGVESDMVLGDSARLQQAIWNLLSNAIKFTPRGGRVMVSVERRDAEVEVAVSDTGEGIDPTVLPFVFDRFRQGDSGTTRAHTGLGLGLAIVRHIVELHGGRVDVRSLGKGQGSTFRILLPMAVADRRAETVAALEAAGASLGAPALDGVRALVVDDDRDARELVSELLRGRGVQVTTAESGAECLERLDRELPDIIISDIAMSGIDGYELMARVRERQPERGGRIPAVAVTAYARHEDTERSLTAGFQAHLSKPVHINDLLTTIASLTLRTVT